MIEFSRFVAIKRAGKGRAVGGGDHVVKAQEFALVLFGLYAHPFVIRFPQDHTIPDKTEIAPRFVLHQATNIKTAVDLCIATLGRIIGKEPPRLDIGPNQLFFVGIPHRPLTDDGIFLR